MAWVIKITKPSMLGMRKHRNAMTVMNAICRYIKRHTVLVVGLQGLGQKARTTRLAKHVGRAGHVGDQRCHGSSQACPHEQDVNPRRPEALAEDLVGLVEAVDQVHLGLGRHNGNDQSARDEDDERKDHADEDGERELLLGVLELFDMRSIHIDACIGEEHAGGQ